MIGTSTEATTVPARRLCLFRLGELELGLEVTDVQEVTEQLPVTWVPMSPVGVAGVANLRGQLVTVLDLRHLLALGPAAPGAGAEAPVDVLVRHSGELLGLPVDAVAEVLDVPVGTRTRPPDNLTGPVRPLVRAVHVLDVGLALELDVPALVSAARTGPPRCPSRGSQPS